MITTAQYEQAKANGISGSALRKRVNKLGWSIELAVSAPIMSQSEITERAKAASYFGKSNPLFFNRKEVFK